MEDLAKFGYKPDMMYEFLLINLLLYLFIAYKLKTNHRNLRIFNFFLFLKNVLWRLKPSD